MTTLHPSQFPEALAKSLVAMAKTGDRASPVVFGGREGELGLLDDAVDATRRGQAGRTVVIKGVPGAGKTALLNEYADRLLNADDASGDVVLPVPLQAADVDVAPAELVAHVDNEFRKVRESSAWRTRANQWGGKLGLVGNTLFALGTRTRFGEFLKSARAPHSLRVALDDYMAVKFDNRPCTVVLLVDEAQNLPSTAMVKRHLGAMHGGVGGKTRVLLVCFGLSNTDDHLASLGISRLTREHVRRISTLDAQAARKVVRGTIERMVNDHRFSETFDEDVRREWIKRAATVVLDESADFPHHITNGCGALATVLLREGIGDDPPEASVVEECKRHKRDYYNARLRKWANHTIALACAFEHPRDGWTPTARIKQALSFADNDGEPVDPVAAAEMVRALRDDGYVESNGSLCKPALPSMATHFHELREGFLSGDTVFRAVRTELAAGAERTTSGQIR